MGPEIRLQGGGLDEALDPIVSDPDQVSDRRIEVTPTDDQVDVGRLVGQDRAHGRVESAVERGPQGSRYAGRRHGLAIGAGVDGDRSRRRRPRHELLGPELRRSRQASQNAWAHLVVALHAREVHGRLGLPLQDEVHEVVLAPQRVVDRGVVSTLVADGALRYRAERLAARGARTVPRPDLHVIVERQEPLERRVQRAGRGVHDARVARGLLQQIRPPQVAHEHEVAARDPDRRVRSRPVVEDQEGEVFGRVTRGMQGLDLDVADGERIAVPEEPMIVGAVLHPLVFPVRVALVRQIELRPARFGHLPRARQEVGVDVRLRGGGDPEVVLLRDLQVAVDVPLGVDDDGRARLLTPDQVRVLREPLVCDLSEEHRCRPFNARRPRPAGIISDVGGAA